MYGVVGVSLAVALLLVLALFGVFSERAESAEAFLGAFALIIGVFFAYLVGTVLAVLVGADSARFSASRTGAGGAAFLAAGVGHLVLAFLFMVTLMLGIAVLLPGNGDIGGGEADGGGVAEFDTLAKLLLGALPAAVAAAATDAIMFRRAPVTVSPMAKPGGAPA